MFSKSHPGCNRRIKNHCAKLHFRGWKCCVAIDLLWRETSSCFNSKTMVKDIIIIFKIVHLSTDSISSNGIKRRIVDEPTIANRFVPFSGFQQCILLISFRRRATHPRCSLRRGDERRFSV
mmetsp:Transcript_6067/g.12337  ORF Transcript_6067/g.12337 Transcript_6067/m.12337 type:complete len:121 (+) Transcript_6067:286-648(+)